MARTCRVIPDVPALARVFDYELPDGFNARVGTIVRVSLQGRRVRGWIEALDVEPEAAEIQPVLAVVSDGPPGELVSLTKWIARRWVGPRTHPLRSASPPNVAALQVTGGTAAEPPGFSLSVTITPAAADRVGAVRSVLANEGSTVVVVPARAGAFANRVSDRDVVTLVASTPDAERTRRWSRAREGSCVVVGGRLAALAPVPDLAAVVILDDADEALKEERAPAWHARDVAIERARRAGVPVYIFTPVPTVEDLVLEPDPAVPSRPDARDGWARLEIADLRDERPGRRVLGDRLVAAVRRAVDAGERVVCVLNRKGRARLLACSKCEHIATCEVCEAAVAGGDELTCPRCGATRPVVCRECGSTRLRILRPGIASLRDDLAALFPRVEVAELDASGEGNADAQIVVGTEAALHRVRGRIAVVAFPEFDQELLAPRFRASQQAWWLLVRASRLVAGRAGRVVVQTRAPDHDVLVGARGADPLPSVRADAEFRRASRMPPFGGVALLSGGDDAVRLAGDALVAEGAEVFALDGHALVRAPDPDALADAFAHADLDRARAAGRLRVEVDPVRV